MKSFSALRFLTLLATLCALYAQTVAAQPRPAKTEPLPKARVEEFIARYGLDRQLEALSKSIPGQIEADFEGATNMSPDRKKRVIQASEKAFTAKRMQDFMRGYIARTGQADDVTLFIEFFDTVLGKKVSAMEQAAAKADAADTQAKMEKMADTFETNQPGRYVMVSRYEKATRSAEFVSTMFESNAVIGQRGAAATSDKAVVFDFERQRNEFRDDNRELGANLRPALILSSALMFEKLSDDEFSRYVSLLETPMAGRVIDMMHKGFIEMYNQIGEEMGKSLGRK